MLADKAYLKILYLAKFLVRIIGVRRYLYHRLEEELRNPVVPRYWKSVKGFLRYWWIKLTPFSDIFLCTTEEVATCVGGVGGRIPQYRTVRTVRTVNLIEIPAAAVF